MEISDLESRGIELSVAKTKALISFAVSAKLICTFAFAYADCWFSHAAAHLFYLYYLFQVMLVVAEYPVCFRGPELGLESISLLI